MEEHFTFLEIGDLQKKLEELSVYILLVKAEILLQNANTPIDTTLNDEIE